VRMCEWKRCVHRKSFSCTHWSWIPHWAGKEQVCHGWSILLCFHTHHENSRRALFLHCSDIVEMASYAPLLVNYNDRRYQSHSILQKLIQACTSRNNIFFSGYSDIEWNYSMKVGSRCNCLQLVKALWNSELLGAKVLHRVEWSNSFWC